jgi:hypothetical protein
MKAFKYALLSAAVSAQSSQIDEFNRKIAIITDRAQQFEQEKARNECNNRINEALEE